MAKRSSGRTGAKATSAGDATTAQGMEQRVLAFAKDVGWVAGTIQAKAEGWMDREALSKQLAGVRDGAAQLLRQLAGPAETTAKGPKPTARRGVKGRSGGMVDAPGKTHRKRAPRDPDSRLARSQAGKLRAAMPMEKTTKRRGRG